MNFEIVNPYATILDDIDDIAMLKKLERIGRVSHMSEDRITDDSYIRFIKSVVMNHGDMSIIEHVSVSVEFVVDRGITHELVRHRIASYTQESTRFVNYNKRTPRFIIPNFVDWRNVGSWSSHIEDCVNRYELMLVRGESPQLARSILPNSLAATIIVTMNLRSWRHFFIMRTSRETHPQMRQVTEPLLEDFKKKIPILFDDIVPGARQAESMRLLR